MGLCLNLLNGGVSAFHSATHFYLSVHSLHPLNIRLDYRTRSQTLHHSIVMILYNHDISMYDHITSVCPTGFNSNRWCLQFLGSFRCAEDFKLSNVKYYLKCTQ